MVKEKSCGAVIYRINNNTIEYLIIRHKKGHCSFPKGHVEKGETEKETAIREIKEETNIDVIVDTGFRMISTYSPKPKVMKDVILFVAEAISNNPIPQEEEVESIGYYEYEEAMNTLIHNRDKEILKEANIYITKKILK